MPDDFASDEQLIEDAHKALKRLADTSGAVTLQIAADAAITAIGKRLIQRTKEKQADEEKIERLTIIASYNYNLAKKRL